MANTRRTAAKAEAVEPVTVAETEQVEAVKPEKQTVKKIKKFAPDDMIPCRSNTVGTLLYNGHKTNLPYQFSNMGDVSYIAYQDILAAFMVNSAYIFDPLFIIEDEDVLDDPRFARVKQLYENLYDKDDIEKLLQLPPIQFRNVLMKAPIGLRNVVKNIVGGLVVNGNFDSIQKVKIIDELCGTDFRSMM